MLARSYQLDVKKLESLLIQRGWAADEIALRGVFSQRRVEQIMQGARVYRSNLKRLADLFGVQPQDLILAEPQEATAAPPLPVTAELSLQLREMTVEFSDHSVLLQQFGAWIKEISQKDATLVDFDDNDGRVRLTIELPAKSLIKIYLALVTASELFSCVGTDEYPSFWRRILRMPLLPFIDNIQFPDDSPLLPLRGKTLRAADGFETREPINWDSVDF